MSWRGLTRAHGSECLAIRELRMQCHAIVGAAVNALPLFGSKSS
jgi:hypothetical protein